MRLPIVIVCLLLMLSSNIEMHAQYRFFHYTPDEGLIDNTVRCFLKDRNGFLWIGTNSGLSRFDGFRFTNFICNPADSASLSSNQVVHLFEDSNGLIWISTHGMAPTSSKASFKRLRSEGGAFTPVCTENARPLACPAPW